MMGLLLTLCVPAAMQPVPRIARPVAIVGATLIDGTGAPPLRESAVLIRDGRIAAVWPTAKTPIPADAETVDARGKWLLPGLIDMHVHLDEVISPEAFVLFGVTSVRDLGSRLVTLQRLHARAARGEVLPHFYWYGRNIDEGKPSWWGAVAAKGPKEVPALLADMVRQGVDGVKLYVNARPDVARAVIQEAHRRGWPVTGHLQNTTPSQAAELGIDNLEHAWILASELRRTPPGTKPGFAAAFAGVPDINLDSSPAQRLIHLLAARHVAITPTLVASEMPVEGVAGAGKVYNVWADVPEGWRKHWAQPYWDFIGTKGWTPGAFRTARAANAKLRELVGRLYREGVPIVAGTDTPAPWVLPGAGLVHELEMLVESGLSPMDAIRAATGCAAQVMRKDRNLGTITPGRSADLILLDSDPLTDIRALRHVTAVYLAGRPVDLRSLRRSFRATSPIPLKPGG